MADLFIRARERAAAAGTIPAIVGDVEDARRWMIDQVSSGQECWLAETERSELAGLLILGDGWLEQLYLDPDLTGRGIGSQLVEVAKRERPGGLRLWVFVSNEGAQRFYARHGFVEVLRTDGSENMERAPDIQWAWVPSPAAAERP